MGVVFLVFLEGAGFNAFCIFCIFVGPCYSVEVEDVAFIGSQFKNDAVIWVCGLYGPHPASLAIWTYWVF